MKAVFQYLIVAAAVLAAVGCRQTISPALSVSPPSLQFIAAGEEKTIEVTANVLWTISELPAWIEQVKPSTGKGTATVTVKAKANTTAQSRENDSFIITATDVPVLAVKVYQDPAIKVSTKAIAGIPAPVAGATPVTVVPETEQYTGTVTWEPDHKPFDPHRVYTATITLTPKPGYTFDGVDANYFTVAGVTTDGVRNYTGSFVITAEFLETGALPVDIATIGGVTPPAVGETPVVAITETPQYTGTVAWSPEVTDKFAGVQVYTATITLDVKDGFSLTGVDANFFTVEGVSTPATNAAGEGVITAIFPATSAAIVNIAEIKGVTAPVMNAEPVLSITATTQYAGTIAWKPDVVGNAFAASKEYTATITLEAEPGFTFTGVKANFFEVAGAKTGGVSNPANSGVVTAIFPATGNMIPPVLTTSDATSVTQTTATLGGSITNTGTPAYTERGVCYATTQNPTTANNKTVVTGAGATGTFSTPVSGLTANTTYYVRTYAIQEGTPHYGEQVNFTTPAILPVLNTSAATDITSNSATLGGNITNAGTPAYTERGVCYAATPNPTIANKTVASGAGATGTFSTPVSGLAANTTYYVRAYVVQNGTACYGDELNFKTSSILPTLNTSAATDVTFNSATLGGNITNTGTPAYTERGVCYATTQNPTTANNKTVVTGAVATGTFSTPVSGLTANTTYYVRAYVIHEGTAHYGEQMNFTTSIITPVLTTNAAAFITSSSATLGGNITNAGTPAYNERGVCYATTPDPTTANKTVVTGAGETGDFSTTVSDLTANTTYYVRAYVIHEGTVYYGNQEIFTTSVIQPTLTTSAATDVTSNSATLGGNITNAGTPAYTERGVCYAATPNPTTDNKKEVTGAGETGSFSTPVSGLAASTTYYVRAYVIQNGTPHYGAQESFTTSKILPELNTSYATSVTSNSATLGGNITNAGTPAYNERGVCYATTPDPTTANKAVVTGAGETGSFSTTVSGLAANTTYYVRAYVIQDGTPYYGNQEVFSTSKIQPELTTNGVTVFNQNTATLGGNITNEGAPAYTERGVCYDNWQNPTTATNKIVISGTGTTGSFSTTVSGLTANTTYYVRAYVIQDGTAYYGDQVSFTTWPPPTVSVGSQVGGLIAGNTNSVTFQVVTAGIADGQAGTITNTNSAGTPLTLIPFDTPTISVSNVSGNSATVTATGKAGQGGLGLGATTAGNYYFTVTIAGVTSNVAKLTVLPNLTYNDFTGVWWNGMSGANETFYNFVPNLVIRSGGAFAQGFTSTISTWTGATNNNASTKDDYPIGYTITGIVTATNVLGSPAVGSTYQTTVYMSFNKRSIVVGTSATVYTKQ